MAAILHGRCRTPQNSPPPAPFTNQDITQRFLAGLPEITSQLNLELAVSQQIETFTRSDNRTLLWGLIDFGRNVVQISVPVTYRYHVQLRDPWKLQIHQQTLTVQAPPLRAALPPSIHTDHLTTLSVRGWARGSTVGIQKELEQQITPLLSLYASDPRRLNLVRETCRLSVVAFVRLWLEREQQEFNQIQVIFADEPSLPADTNCWPKAGQGS